MSYASDKLYNGYLRKNMARIVSTVKPREIIIHLPCLTEHDRESIEAKNDFSGNFEAMKLLLNCLKRRENWPEHFITALEECDYGPIATEIRAEYNKLRGINNSSPPPPASPAANVVTVNVHPEPSAPHLPDPGPATSVLPAQDVPPGTQEVCPIQETETPAPSTPAKAAAPVVEETTTPEPLHIQAEPQTQAVVVPPSTPPPSPSSARDSANPTPPPEQVDFISHQEPEENLEPSIVQAQVGVPNETVTIQQEAEEDTEVPLAADPREEPCEIGDSMEANTLVDEPPPAIVIENEKAQSIEIIYKPVLVEPEPVTVVMEVPTQSAATVEEDSLTTTIVDNPNAPPVAIEVPAARSTSPMTNLDDLILTPEKPPVQETRPKEEKVPTVVPVLEETAEPQKTQVVQIVQEIEDVPTVPAEIENGEDDQSLVSEEEDICFSKPGVLMSVAPPDQNNTTICPPTPDPTPYSGDSGRLEMSEVETSVPSFQENGISQKQPDEDISETPAPSLYEEDVEESVGHVAEEPSILNKEVQMPLIEDDGEPTKEATTTVSCVQATTLLSDPSCCTNAGDMSEPPTPSLDVEDVEENLIHVMEQPSILNEENQTPLTEDSKEQAIELNISSTTMISDASSYPNEESISKSPAPSLDMDDVRETVGHVAEEPSVLNLDVQTQVLHVNGESPTETTSATVISDITSVPNVVHEAATFDRNLNLEVQTPIIQVNGEPAKEITTAPTTNDNHQPNAPPVDQKLPTSGLSTRQILTAAGVGACALLIAWRLKH